MQSLEDEIERLRQYLNEAREVPDLAQPLLEIVVFLDRRLDSLEARLRQRIQVNRESVAEVKRLIGYVLMAMGLAYLWVTIPEGDRTQFAKEFIGKIVPYAIGAIGLWLQVPKKDKE